MMETEPRVWNKRDPNKPDDAVYVGRGTPWGNPFVMHAEHQRDASKEVKPQGCGCESYPHTCHERPSNRVEELVPILKPCPFCGIKLSGPEGGAYGHPIGSPDCILSYNAIGPCDFERWNRRTATSPDGVEERVRDAIAKAYLAGATDVHIYWRNGGSDTEPDFAEAASDYAADHAPTLGQATQKE